MQYQVPKFIDRETRIWGSISLRQLAVLGTGGGILFVLYFITNFFTFTIFAIIVSSAAIVVAFVEIGGRPISDLLFSIAEYFIKPRLYLWKKKDTNQDYDFTENVQIQAGRGVQPIQNQQPQQTQGAGGDQELNKETVQDLANMLDE